MISPNNNKGLTLIELLVSLTLISIILISFFYFFIQGAKSNQVSEEIIDATALAQTYMEKFYRISKEHTYISGLATIREDEGFNQVSSNIFKKSENNYYLKLELLQPSTSGISVVRLSVFSDETEKNLKAQMESRLKWKISE
ncbi:type IV pilus modification PilV family protein [Caldifermentibacillus hisashii]|nr:prepilin-type N-terminal cleavage/methylation domain-containing protein [Caldifermentibacillus hisashii]MBU5342599.1 prepilin-type N-terminal cleavage/methylation domain-containing protein [Caldifermentibacillus hisashii]